MALLPFMLVMMYYALSFSKRISIRNIVWRGKTVKPCNILQCCNNIFGYFTITDNNIRFAALNTYCSMAPYLGSISTGAHYIPHT